MTKKKPDLYDLFNDDSLWGNQETDALSHDDIMDKKWNLKRTKQQKEYASNAQSLKGKTIEEFYGKKVADAKRKKHSKANKGKVRSEEFKAHLSKILTGKSRPMSEEGLKSFREKQGINIEHEGVVYNTWKDLEEGTGITPWIYHNNDNPVAKAKFTDSDILDIYERCKPWYSQRGAKEFYQSLADELNTSFGIIQSIARGERYEVLKNICTQWKGERFGTITITTPSGVKKQFTHIDDATSYLDKQDHPQKDIHKFFLNELLKMEPNVPYVKERRYWKDWIFEKTL